MSKEEKAGVIIGSNFYRFEELHAIWHYFRMNGVPKFDGYHYSFGSPINFDVARHRGEPGLEHIIKAYDSLDVDYLANAYFLLDDAFKKVSALLQLKDRGEPLTKEQFDSKAYDDYLKAFDEETKRLKKEAGIEEKNND